jgi:hypothetical protein
MDDKSLFEGIIKLLNETSDYHLLKENEYLAIATLVDTIAHSNEIIRNHFYTEMVKVARFLDTEQKKIHKEIGGMLRNYRAIWGDKELGEDICKLLDKEDGKPTDVDVIDEPKKKVVN